VIPYDHEEAMLPHLLASLETIQKKANIPIRVLLVDDGSQDRTYEIMLAETRQEFLVRSHNALGIVAWREGSLRGSDVCRTH
jgi:glycosyltransferase involved in cell wall biosynthesis